MVTSPFLT
ncbi:rCG59490, isoform CRA_a [Rattus norvegicus]|uniref:RCG59490, isoform CRA_a n=1 Tax=Rattus norvegicus TaxID=10116 RepID=A6HTE0_RAT|nr:rCG59490, isoform CRA_a [Rattus norvegicus]